MAVEFNPRLDALTQGQKVTALWRDAIAYRQDLNTAIGEELDFSLKLKHYVDDWGETRDRRRIQPKGRELISKLRHKGAEITKEFYLTVRPVDEQTDPQASELSRWVLQQDCMDPVKDYAQVRDDVALLALAGRIGVATLDYVPGIGAFGGEIVPRVVDARQFYWTPGWKSPHDPTCPWVIEVRRMRVADVKRMRKAGWKNTEELRGDGGVGGTQGKGDPSLAPGLVRFPTGNAGNPSPGVSEVEPHVTLLVYWGRFDDTEKTRAKKNGMRKLRPEQRYMRCDACGYEQRGEDGTSLPSEGGACPQCITANQMNPLERVDAEIETETVLAYPRGRFTITCPFDEDKELVDGDWPFKVRSVPYLVVHGYPHPLEPIGMSDTAYDWSLQLITDALLRQAYEQMSENRDLIISPVDGLVDAENEPWQFADTQGRIAYWTGQGAPQVMHFRGAGVPAGWREVFGQVQSVLMRDMGTSDIAIGSEQTRNIPVGTVRAMQETGEIPVDHHKRRFWRAESIFLGCWLDMIRDTWSQERLVRLNPENGENIFRSLRGADIPNVDVVVSAAPAIGSVDQQEVQALLQVFNAPPPQMEILGRKLNVPQSEIHEYQQKMEAFKQQNQPQPPPPSPDKILVAIADILKANPGYVSYDQVQQALGMAGIQPQPQMDPIQAAHIRKSTAPEPPPAPPGMTNGKATSPNTPQKKNVEQVRS